MLDKLFFVDKVDAKVFIDFGCADGTLFKYMRPYLPDGEFVGFDSDEPMCERARAAAGDAPFTNFYSDWEAVEGYILSAKSRKVKTAVILSSIIHEVYHYTEPKEIDAFWKRIFTTGFDYIIIRDMIPNEAVDRAACMGDVAKVLRRFRDKKELKDFERRWGSIEGNKNLLHFLLKYKYTAPNWDREVKENYLPLYREDLLAMLPSDYEVLYHEHGPLPYIKRSVRDDFGIELKDATHLKLILERRA
jgi:hypothetical protein